MAFIVKRIINGKDYYYLRESKRVGSKVKSVSLGYLGKDKEQAEKNAEKILTQLKDRTIVKKEKTKMVAGAENLKQENTAISIEELSNFCKSKGFVFRSSDIYGGFSGFWDFGPLGVELLNNIKKEWWDFFVQEKENMLGLEASIISHPRTWKASGHIKNFNDVAVICKKCKTATKIDKNEIGKTKCECGGEYWVQGEFNLMFKTNVGAINPVEAYLRGETAQAMFMDFKLIQQTSRLQLPFGIAQIGKCFRNEIAPRDFLFRSREFHIGEFEFFINPEDDECVLLDNFHLNIKLNLLDAETQAQEETMMKEVTIKEMLDKNKLGKWHAYWLAEQIIWLKKLGLNEIKIREHTKGELSHYSSATFDVDYEYPFGSKEIAGIANRGQFDLTQHQNESKENMEIFDEKFGKKVLPRVIEPTFGIERVFLAVLAKAYSYDSKRGNVVLKLHPRIAPIKAAIFPIVKQPEFENIAREIFEDLKKEFRVVYDKSGSIGRRYARNDEIGTPFCITIDGDSLKNKDVTVRDINTTKQIRVKILDLKNILKQLINQEIKFEKAGKLIN